MEPFTGQLILLTLTQLLILLTPYYNNPNRSLTPYSTNPNPFLY